MKKLPSFFAGALTMLLVMSLVVGASAYSGKVTKELTYNNISVTLDGKKLDLRDVQGNSVEPFIFDGTNYLPVRAISEALGLTVSWDGATNTVVLQSPNGVNQSEAYKALSGWIANNHTFYADGILAYSADATNGSGLYAVARDISGEVTLMREYRKSGAKIQMLITLAETGNIHLFSYYYTAPGATTSSIIGGGAIDAEKLNGSDGFFFSSADAAGKELEMHNDLARAAALDALSFLDDVFTSRMKSAYDISDLGFARESIIK